MVTRVEISRAAAILGKKGGEAKNKRKTEAVRLNARLGGRPRKKPRILGLDKGKARRKLSRNVG